MVECNLPKVEVAGSSPVSRCVVPGVGYNSELTRDST
jgi:hypothetical protein